MTHPKADPADNDHQTTGEEVAPDVERDLKKLELSAYKKQGSPYMEIETFLSKTMSKPELVLSSFWI